MLLIKAYPSMSAIHGIGLFAGQTISAATKVWEFREGFDVMLCEGDLHDLSETARLQVKHYAYFCPKRQVYILSSDDDRFTNHSIHPNTKFDGHCSFALREIKAGEEITVDYSDFEIILTSAPV